MSLDYSPPCLLTRAAQRSSYAIYDAPTSVKAGIVTTIAILAIGLVTLSLLNRYHLVDLVNSNLEKRFLIAGASLGGGFLVSLFLYRFSKKYDRNQKNGSTFLSKQPRWYSTKTFEGGASKLRSKSKYYDWFTFLVPRKSQFDETTTPHVKMTENQKVIVKWEYDQQAQYPKQNIYFEDQGNTTLLHTVDLGTSYLSHSQHRYYPYLKDNTLLALSRDQTTGYVGIQEFDLDAEKLTQKSFSTAYPDIVSLIRCCDDILIIGYQSGLVQFVDYTSGNLISSYKAEAEVLDAWVDAQENRVVVFTNMSYTMDGMRRRKQEVWQF